MECCQNTWLLVFVGYTLVLAFALTCRIKKDYGRLGYSDDDDAIFNNVFVIDYATCLRKSKEQKVPKKNPQKESFQSEVLTFLHVFFF